MYYKLVTFTQYANTFRIPYRYFYDFTLHFFDIKITFELKYLSISYAIFQS